VNEKGLRFERIGTDRHYNIVLHIGSTYVPVSDDTLEALKAQTLLPAERFLDVLVDKIGYSSYLKEQIRGELAVNGDPHTQITVASRHDSRSVSLRDRIGSRSSVRRVLLVPHAGEHRPTPAFEIRPPGQVKATVEGKVWEDLPNWPSVTSAVTCLHTSHVPPILNRWARIAFFLDWSFSNLSAFAKCSIASVPLPRSA